MSGTAVETKIDEQALFRKITWRLIPYMFVLYILAYLDRVNVGFAAKEMQHDLSLTATVYGTGAGIFFLGSAMFDLPSNLLLGKVGPRIWIARIMITWGMVASCMSLVVGAHSFYAMRFLLGVSEAGFFPGMILYLAIWFPLRERARAVAKFMTATSIAGVVGSPLSAAILKLEGARGLHGWQWLFILEGIPTILMGLSVLFILKDKPDDVSWLSDAEKAWLDSELEQDRKQGGADTHSKLGDAFKSPLVWILAAVFAIDQIGVYTVNLWMPLVTSSFVTLKSQMTMLPYYGTLPYLAAAVGSVLVSRSSDRSGERRGHIAGCLALSAVGFALIGMTHSLTIAVVGFTLAAIGYWSIMGPFWTLPTRVLGGRASAGGVAIITMVGGCGGFLGPYLTGRLRDATHSFSLGLFVIAAVTVLAGVLALTVGGQGKKATG